MKFWGGEKKEKLKKNIEELREIVLFLKREKCVDDEKCTLIIRNIYDLKKDIQDIINEHIIFENETL